MLFNMRIFPMDPFKMPDKTFAMPMRHIVFKHLMSDADLRNSFIRTFTPLKSVVSSVMETNASRPNKADENLLYTIRTRNFDDFMKFKHRFEFSTSLFKNIQKDRNLQPLCQDKVALHGDVVAKVNKELSHLQLSRLFFDRFSKNFESIQQTLLHEKDGHCDVICKLNSGEHVLVQAKVMSENALDPRFLAYARGVYGNQLHQGQWDKLKAVYAVNIMACKSSTEFHSSPFGEYRRHYKMTDLSIQGKPRSLDQLNFIQISLHDVDLEEVADVEERWWLDFFKNGGYYTAVPKGCPPLIKQAYDRIRTDALPPAIRSALDVEDGRYRNFKGLLERSREEGRKEAMKELLREMLLNDEISQETYESQLADLAPSVPTTVAPSVESC
jgi:hypothetical protein